MSVAPGPNGAGRLDAEELREQIAEHRRDLADTVSVLRDKTDLKARMRDRAAGAEIAVAGLARRAGRTVDAVPRLFRWGAGLAGEQAHKVARPVRGPAEQAAGMLRRRIRLFLTMWLAIVAVMAARRRRG